VVSNDAVFVAGVTAAAKEQRAIAMLPDDSIVAAGEITVLGQGTDAWLRRWAP